MYFEERGCIYCEFCGGYGGLDVNLFLEREDRNKKED